jgi:hypothetical protein
MGVYNYTGEVVTYLERSTHLCQEVRSSSNRRRQRLEVEAMKAEAARWLRVGFRTE